MSRTSTQGAGTQLFFWSVKVSSKDSPTVGVPGSRVRRTSTPRSATRGQAQATRKRMARAYPNANAGRMAVRYAKKRSRARLMPRKTRLKGLGWPPYRPRSS